MAGHVYLIGSTRFKWYKIGKSSNATIRITDLGILLPFRIEVIAVAKCNAYHHLEHYSEHRVNGEWFSFTPEKLKEVIEDLCLRGEPTNALIGFTNIPFTEQDRITAEKRAARLAKKGAKALLTPEERERRKQEAIAARQLRKSLTPP